jgi:hypothetical protein
MRHALVTESEVAVIMGDHDPLLDVSEGELLFIACATEGNGRL